MSSQIIHVCVPITHHQAKSICHRHGNKLPVAGKGVSLSGSYLDVYHYWGDCPRPGYTFRLDGWVHLVAEECARLLHLSPRV